MMLLYMVAFIINIAQMFAYIPAPWILWEMGVAQNELLIVENPSIDIIDIDSSFHFQKLGWSN